MPTQSIDLAPNHKLGLTVNSPILVAGGVVSVGDPIPSAIRDAGVGALVVGPITHTSRRGAPLPRLAEHIGGFVVNAGLQNRGVRNMVKRLAKTRNRMDCPIIAQVADREPHHLQRVVQQIEASSTCSGIELLLHPDVRAAEQFELMNAIHDASELPVWIKLPFGCSSELATAAVDAGADALVIAQPPIGSYPYHAITGVTSPEPTSDAIVAGSAYGVGLFSQILTQAISLISLDLSIPVILCGGVHTSQDVDVALNMGAAAVQLDSALWVEPGLAKILVGQCDSAS